METKEEVRSAGSLIDGLLGDLQPTQESFDVWIGRTKFVFRYLKDGDEWDRLKNEAATWTNTVRGKACPVQLKSIRVKVVDHLVWCFLLSSLCLSGQSFVTNPETQLKEPLGDPEGVGAAEWMKLAKNGTLAFETVKERVDDEITGNARLRDLEAFQAGKDD